MASSPFLYFCAEDYNTWAREALVNCEAPLFNTGVIEADAEFDQFAAGNGWAGEGFFWSTQGDLVDDVSVPEVGADCAPCTTLMQKSERWHKSQFHKCWTLPELQKACNRTGVAPGDEMPAVMAEYGQALVSIAALATMKGIYLNNVADDSSDLIVDATTLPVETNFVSRYAAVCAEALVGCGGDEMPMILMHTDVYTNKRKTGEILMMEVDCDDGQCVNRAFFEGKQVQHVRSDYLRDGADYITAMLRPGSLALGRADLDNAMTNDYDNCADGGTGSNQIYTRDCMVLHARGFSNIFNGDGTAATLTPTIADMALATSYTRSIEAENSNFVFIKSTEV